MTVQADHMRRRQAHSIAFVSYAVTLLSMATIGVIAPLVGTLAVAANVPVARVGFAIALFSVPSAVCSCLAGPLSDRCGAGRVLAGSSLLAAAAAFFLYKASSLMELRIGLLSAGVAFCGVVVSAPASIMAHLDGDSRSRWLSLWSTYGPAGFAIGLLLTAAFAQGAQARGGLLVVGALLTIGGVAAAYLSGNTGAGMRGARDGDGTLARRVGAVLTLARDQRIVRLAAAIALPTGISYGTSLLMPSYFSTVYGVTIATASGVVALAKLVIVVAGGLASGWLLARRVGVKPLFLGLCLIGFLAQAILYYPGSGFVPAVMALAVWLFVYAGMCGIGMALLPRLIESAATGGAASGLVSQAISCTSFLGSIVYFGAVPWQMFVVIAACGLAIASALLPDRLSHADARAAFR